MRQILLALFIGLATTLSAQEVINTFFVDFGPNDGSNGNQTFNPQLGNTWNNRINFRTDGTDSLLDAEANASPLTLSVTAPFSSNGINHGGLLSPEESLLGDFAVATATQDYFFTTTSGSLSIGGLDESKQYRFSFFGTRENTQTRTTNYNLSGRGGTQTVSLTTSGAGIGANGYDGNNNALAIVESIAPATGGNITIQVERAAGQFAYIGALRIEELEGSDIVPVTAINLSGTDITDNGGATSLVASVEPANATFQTVAWSVDNPFLAAIDQRGTITAIADGTVTVTATSNQPGTSVSAQIEVEISNQNSRSFFLDCGTLAAPTVSPDEFGNHWNNSTVSFSSADPIIMVDATGAATDVVLTIGKAMSARDVSAGGLAAPVAAEIGALGIASATEDFFFTSNSGILTFSGLDADRGYRFHLFGSRAQDTEQSTRYTASGLNGSSVDLRTSGPEIGSNGFTGNTDMTVVTELVKPDETGTINLQIFDAIGGAGYVNAVRMMEYGDFDICPDRFDLGITVIGSSVARGQGAPMDMGYAFQYTNLLADRFDANESDNEFEVRNVSIGGQNTVNVLNRFGSDVVEECGSFVVIGLSLANEGIRNGGQAIYDQFQTNMATLIARSKAAGLTPIIVSNYPRGDYDLGDYEFIKDINQWIYTQDVPSVNVLGPVDNGAGQWITSIQQDNGHPNLAGHEEFASSFVPSLFDALDRGKPIPVLNNLGSVNVSGANMGGATIAYDVEEGARSFTLAFEYSTTLGAATVAIASLPGGIADMNLTFGGGKVSLVTPSGIRVTGATDIDDGTYHDIALTYQSLTGELDLFVDGQMEGSTSFPGFSIDNFFISGVELDQEDNFRNLLLYRANLNADEIALLADDVLLQGSLELYCSLSLTCAGPSCFATNLAQSTSEIDVLFLVDTDEPTVPAKALNLTVAPNPVTDQLLVRVREGIGIQSVSVLDLTGRVILKNASTSLALGHLQAGGYLLRVVTDRGVATTRFIKR